MMHELDTFAQLPPHPSIIRPFAVTMLNVPQTKTYYLAMISELWPKSLYETMKMMSIYEAAFTVEDVALVARTIAEAIRTCSEVGIVHCDLSPKNVMVQYVMEDVDRASLPVQVRDDETDGGRRPKRWLRIHRVGIIDFNLAGPMYDKFSPRMMAKRKAYAYYPPDQDITPAVDIFSLGHIVNSMLAYVDVKMKTCTSSTGKRHDIVLNRLHRISKACLQSLPDLRPTTDDFMEAIPSSLDSL